MPRTYEPIASTTLGSDAASVTFSSIPQTYTDLIVVVEGAASGDSNPFIRVGNGSADSGSNYSYTYVGGGSGGTESSRASNGANGLYGGYTGSNNQRFMSIWQIMSYANTNVNKTALAACAATSNGAVFRSVALWRSTSAIDTLEVRVNSNQYRSGTTFAVYGVKAA